ncbi:MAG: alpha-amylase [Chlorobiaceae bacterium]|nr:alpha-amylase [Chlorobiaceae bacterium]NTV61176.1 alpha-amylase [Chlorobiaceae bacterium]
MSNWSDKSVFYHIYPLGCCGAPPENDFSSPPQGRLRRLCSTAERIRNRGFTAVYLGPVFESSRHGYDTADYHLTDRRLGTNEDLAALCEAFHDAGLRIVFDAVFNHVGRKFHAFRDLLEKKNASAYCGWFEKLDFSNPNACGDPFSYATWQGYHDLAKLNLGNAEVREHLFHAVDQWIRNYNIDGLRLDAADCMDREFLSALAAHCRKRKPDFWLMGEVVQGNYSDWASPGCLDSVTNYEAYKGLYSSFNDGNFFEIAWTMNRLSGAEGICRNVNLYNFADNHDVDRIASRLKDGRHLHPLYCLLFAMPGVPSIYYGSEFGITGKKHEGSDQPLRPALDIENLPALTGGEKLAATISSLASLRIGNAALQHGTYEPLAVKDRQLGFLRRTPDQAIAVLINSSDTTADMECRLDSFAGKNLRDLLNPGWSVPITEGRMQISIDGNWARFLEVT